MRGKGFDNKGFTLVELLVTISILSILMTIAVITYQNLQKNARDNKRKADIVSIQANLEQYHADQGFYPNSLSFGSAFTFGTKTYMAKIPQDSQTAYLYVYSASPGGCTTKCTNYCLSAPLENLSNAVNVLACGSTPPVRQTYEGTAP